MHFITPLSTLRNFPAENSLRSKAFVSHCTALNVKLVLVGTSAAAKIKTRVSLIKVCRLYISDTVSAILGCVSDMRPTWRTE